MLSNTPSPDNERWPQTLIDLLERQYALVDQLDVLARQQADFIEQSATDQLMNLLSQRQGIIDQFTSSQSELSHLTQGMDDRLQQASADQRDRIKSLISEIGDRLAGVMHRDEKDQASLRSNRDSIKQEMSALGAAKQARGAYASKSNPARFADRRG
jgi:hypothetical protein